ncbi:MAG: FecR domain-containing protein [Bacteroidales bacterium]|nr:FecR domain-containing protein [Bacteroidales bacterium]
MTEERTYGEMELLIAKVLAGEATEAEVSLLQKWIDIDAKHRKLYDEYKKLWEKTSAVKEKPTIDMEAAWSRFEKEIDNKTAKKTVVRSLFYKKAMRVAAIFVIVLISGAIYFIYQGLNPGTTTFATNTGEINTHELPDGTFITLNGESCISYSKKFGKEDREIEFEGEAFYKVARDKEIPFVIKTENTRITVLGTSFNVRAYEKEEEVVLVVNSGKVAFTDKDQSHEVILNAGDKGVFAKSDHHLQKTSNKDPNFLAWKTRKFTFEDVPLNEIIATINTVYQSDIVLSNHEIGDCRMTSSFNNQTLEMVIEVICATFDLSFEKKGGKKYILSGDGC